MSRRNRLTPPASYFASGTIGNSFLHVLERNSLTASASQDSAQLCSWKHRQHNCTTIGMQEELHAISWLQPKVIADRFGNRYSASSTNYRFHSTSTVPRHNSIQKHSAE